MNQESFIVFDKKDLPKLVSLINDAAIQMQLYIDRRLGLAEKAFSEQLEVYQALPWYRQWFSNKPYREWNGIISIVALRRKQMLHLVANRDEASGIHITASDMELINNWAARWQLEIRA